MSCIRWCGHCIDADNTSRFGGFGGDFLKEYHSICPKTEPVEEYDDRVMLYELYHHLNHHAMYVSQCHVGLQPHTDISTLSGSVVTTDMELSV